MKYEKKWKILETFLIDLQKRGEKIPEKIIRDLRSAKTTIELAQADPNQVQIKSRIDEYLRNVESYCISTIEKFEKNTAKEWLRKLNQDKNKVNIKKQSFRFVQGIPKNMRWLRVETSEDTPMKEVQKIIIECKLQHELQENGYILVYGNEKSIDFFVKKMTEQFRGEN